jgi:Ca-activated chloride channel family protein
MNASQVGARVLAAAVGLSLLGRTSAAQQEPTFKAGNRTVAVYATVTDAAGRLVPDLTREAFTIFDEKKPQDLTLFANEIQPITVVMLLDRSGSMREQFTLVERAAEQFVAALLPADKARIGSFSNRIQIDPEDFSSNHEELLGILRSQLQEEGPTPLWNAVNVGMTALLHQQGRRVILVFTDGVDSPMNFSNHNHSLRDVMKRAEEENVMVYAVGLAGQNGPPGLGTYGGFGGMGRGGMGRGGTSGGGMGQGGGYGRRIPSDEKPDEGLSKLPAATGGGYFELTSTNDLGSTFARVANELHHQYALGFAPATLDGKMHSLEVRLTNSGMTARARKRYLASKATD